MVISTAITCLIAVGFMVHWVQAWCVAFYFLWIGFVFFSMGGLFFVVVIAMVKVLRAPTQDFIDICPTAFQGGSDSAPGKKPVSLRKMQLIGWAIGSAGVGGGIISITHGIQNFVNFTMPYPNWTVNNINIEDHLLLYIQATTPLIGLWYSWCVFWI